MASPIGWRQPGATLRTSSKRSVNGTPFPLRAQRQMALYSPSERLLWAITLAMRGLWLCCLAECYIAIYRAAVRRLVRPKQAPFVSATMSTAMNSFHAVQQTSA